MIQWKQRLYAFLLRRLLGPFLGDSSSAKQLHDSVDFSLQEGRFTLKDINLNADHLNDIIGSSSSAGVAIKSARIGNLEINLELSENISRTHDGANSTAPRSSLAWRAMKLGSGPATMHAVSLIAKVDVGDIFLELEPGSGKSKKTSQQSHPKPESESEDTKSSRSVIGTYIDAALSSLQLTLNMSNINVRICSSRSLSSPPPVSVSWIDIMLSSVCYRDVEVSVDPNTTNYKTVLNKTVDFTGLKIQAGESQIEIPGDVVSAEVGLGSTQSVSTIALAQGNAQVFIRAIEYGPSNSKFAEISAETESNQSLQHDIEVRMNQQLNISVDRAAIQKIRAVADGLSNSPDAEEEQIQMSRATSEALDRFSVESSNDEDDLIALNGILKQYQEAYHLAERNELRGGILIPSNAFEEGVELDDDEAITFDAFFDANDQSFYHYASVLKESLLVSSDTGGKGDSIHTRLRFYLLGGCIKVVFSDSKRTQSIRRLEEYLLITFDDWSLTSSLSRCTSDLSMTVSHLSIEDAQIDDTYSGEAFISYGGQPLAEGRLDIGNFVQFLTLSLDDADSLGDEMVSPAPSISLHISSRKTMESKTTVYCDLTLSPVELIYRHKTVSNLAGLIGQLATSVEGAEFKTISQRKSMKVRETGKNIKFSGSCPSVMVAVPLLRHVDTDDLHRRCGEVLNDEPVKDSAVGVIFEEISIEYDFSGEKAANVADASEARLLCQNFLFFARSPIGSRTTADTKMQRTDFVIASARMEVDPYIPLSICVVFNASESQERNHGRESFPIVPTISSFKARQEDEDEELKIDRVLFSKLDEVEADSRKELRGTDPQGTMLSNAERCSVVTTVWVPELTVDLTKNELEILLQMVKAATPEQPKDVVVRKGTSGVTDNGSGSLCFAFNCDKFSFFLHNDLSSVEQSVDPSLHSSEHDSCILVMDQFKAHTVIIQSKPQHLRLLCHDPCLYEASVDFDSGSNFSIRHGEKNRFVSVRERGFRSLTDASPIFYRSSLFAPISRESPSILFDFVDQSRKSLSQRNNIQQKNVYFTLYHLTHRYDVTSNWIDRFSGMISDKVGSTSEKDVPGKSRMDQAILSNEKSSLTRIFVTMADCTFDYTSAPYFKTASRTILRVGDLRVSSNYVTPVGRVQAYSISLGDVSVHIINNRYPYQTENSSLCRASKVLDESKRVVAGIDPFVGVSNAETLLREMSFMHVFGLDSMDAIVAVTTDKEKESIDPMTRISMTFGLISMQACKDSFECFSTTIGELQSKLTAKTDKDIEELKVQSKALPPGNDTSHGSLYVTRTTLNEKDNIESLGPLIDTALLRSNPDSPKSFLLDGYDWTTVDHDSLPESDIPEGDDQVARWFVAPEEEGSTTTAYPGRIIHQHFPIHTLSNPLGEGDMDAAKFAGTSAAPSVKSRVLVHDLKFKFRLFDGYDWPEAQTSKKPLFSATDGSSFVIEEIAGSKIGIPDSKRVTSMEPPDASQQRKTKLLGDLLNESGENSTPFGNIPLPEDRGAMLERQALMRRLSRKTHRFFQVSTNGVSVRMDSFNESANHRLVSIMDLSVFDLFVAETVSRPSPLKMIGEWVNEKVHPRDTKDGTLMLKMVTWKPISPVTVENQLANDECEVTMKLLPMRCIVDQRAVSFIRAFFGSGAESQKDEDSWTSGLHLVPPPKFRVFRVKPWKLKVDYCPKKIDIAALRDGSFVELINLSPIDSMVITLQQVSVENVVGMGEVFGGLFGSWVSEICATQLHKFLTNARPFEPFANVSSGVADLVVLPYEAFKNGEDVRRAMRSGISSLAGIVAFETLTTTSRLTQYAANKMAAAVAGTPLQRTSVAANPLPSRPLETPKGVGDVAGHAIESLTRGIQAANYKVVVVPYREYSKRGATGAAKSVLKGIPVLVVAPLSGASEAISYTLLGARNALRPDIRKEEEATLRGLHYEL